VIATLVIGTLLAVCALAFVLYPVFFGATQSLPPPPPASSSEAGESAIAALREIEFDRATGKLSDADYAELKARYTRQAINAMRHGATVASAGPLAAVPIAPPATLPSDDEVEAAVRAYRSRQGTCPACGPRPEPDAIFCSTCGRYLHDRCAGCGAPVVELDARYCARCGGRLAA
jgi:hypothetical protein